MIPVRIQTLIVTAAPAPSIIVLQPVEETQNGKSRVVPIWIGAAEAAQMGVALEKARFTRPMTHDLFLDALTNLDARVDHVVINDVKGAMFFARLTLKQHDRLIDLDARPSDAIALALRQQAPIFIEEDVLERASFPYVFKNAPDAEDELADFRTFLEELAPEDFMAGISAMLKELVGTYQAIKGTEYLFSPSHEVVGKCPRCGGEVAEMQKGFFCQTESCKFAIWKNNKWWEMKHKQPTKAIVTALLKDGRAHVRGLYSEKTGKTYDATVVLADDGQYANFKLEFDQQKGGKR